MKNRDLIRYAMMFAVKDITGRVLREATVQSMMDDFENQLNIPDVSNQRELLARYTKWQHEVIYANEENMYVDIDKFLNG